MRARPQRGRGRADTLAVAVAPPTHERPRHRCGGERCDGQRVTQRGVVKPVDGRCDAAGHGGNGGREVADDVDGGDDAGAIVGGSERDDRAKGRRRTRVRSQIRLRRYRRRTATPCWSRSPLMSPEPRRSAPRCHRASRPRVGLPERGGDCRTEPGDQGDQQAAPQHVVGMCELPVAKAPRACAGTVIRGRSEASAPGRGVPGSGSFHTARIAATEATKHQRR